MGLSVGLFVGLFVGLLVGLLVGLFVGLAVGLVVGECERLGEVDGTSLGASDLCELRTVAATRRERTS